MRIYIIIAAALTLATAEAPLAVIGYERITTPQGSLVACNGTTMMSRGVLSEDEGLKQLLTKTTLDECLRRVIDMMHWDPDRKQHVNPPDEDTNKSDKSETVNIDRMTAAFTFGQECGRSGRSEKDCIDLFVKETSNPRSWLMEQ